MFLEKNCVFTKMNVEYLNRVTTVILFSGRYLPDKVDSNDGLVKDLENFYHLVLANANY